MPLPVMMLTTCYPLFTSCYTMNGWPFRPVYDQERHRNGVSVDRERNGPLLCMMALYGRNDRRFLFFSSSIGARILSFQTFKKKHAPLLDLIIFWTMANICGGGLSKERMSRRCVL
ncbi:hypothetical protein QBC41DRAFT_71914 [Cercophora samala]|uniref:Uncharacterized protein n=1 Tax=Cercophora samala TaxID=330535 RepID=A0AA39ZMX7_9PEZI|nr:hypothetical protein QBC41DRAFT_71914 [Cercophora samala]